MDKIIWNKYLALIKEPELIAVVAIFLGTLYFLPGILSSQNAKNFMGVIGALVIVVFALCLSLIKIYLSRTLLEQQERMIQRYAKELQSLQRNSPSPRKEKTP